MKTVKKRDDTQYGRFIRSLYCVPEIFPDRVWYGFCGPGKKDGDGWPGRMPKRESRLSENENSNWNELILPFLF